MSRRMTDQKANPLLSSFSPLVLRIAILPRFAQKSSAVHSHHSHHIFLGSYESNASGDR